MKTSRRSFLASVAAILGLPLVKVAPKKPIAVQPLPPVARPPSTPQWMDTTGEVASGQFISVDVNGKVRAAHAGDKIVGIALSNSSPTHRYLAAILFDPTYAPRC